MITLKGVAEMSLLQVSSLVKNILGFVIAVIVIA